jgi:hypothetical protein
MPLLESREAALAEERSMQLGLETGAGAQKVVATKDQRSEWPCDAHGHCIDIRRVGGSERRLMISPGAC